MNASFGQNYYSGTMNHNGAVAIGRFGLGHSIFQFATGEISIEAGIQSGNAMRLAFSKKDIDALGGVPIGTHIKPMLDLLIDVDMDPRGGLLYPWIKAGVAYRTLQIDHESINDVSTYSPELQLGLAYRINEQAVFNIGYQIIGGAMPDLTVDHKLEIGSLTQAIPKQQGVLAGISYHF